MSDTDWRALAACATHPAGPSLWCDKPGGDDDISARSKWGHGEQYEAVSVCWNKCSVRVDCLLDAIEQEGTVARENRHTIRGGLTPAQREKVARWIATGLAELATT